jgi:hypothetical protein
MPDNLTCGVVGRDRLGVRPVRGALAMVMAVAGAIGCGADPGEAGPDAGTGSSKQAIGIHGPGGWLHGTARAFYTGVANQVVPLVDASLFAQNVLTGTNGPAVQSDFYGGFHIPVANGKYKVCWSKPGFASGCTSIIYTVNNASVAVGMINFVPPPRRVRGLAKLADDTACMAIDPFIGIKVTPRADVLSPTNAVQATTRLNRHGEFVLPIGGDSAQVRVTCGSATVQANVSAMDHTGTVAHNFVIPNKRPYIKPIVSTVGGQDVQGVFPNTTVHLATVAIDPDGNPLTYTWKAAQGTISNPTTTGADWTVPATQGSFTAYLGVYDGKGGFTTRSVNIRVRSNPVVLFTGNVRDDKGAIVGGADVQVGSVTTTSDSKGHFAMTVPEADSYLLNISKMGYADYSRRMQAPGKGQKHVLATAWPHPFNPTVETIIEDRRPDWLNPCAPRGNCPRVGGKVRIPANSVLLDPPPVGGLTAWIASIDPTSDVMPGDQTATNSGGVPTALLSYGALFIEIRDSVGTKYNLAPGKSAEVNIPIQPNVMADGPPASMDAWKYHPDTGLWDERGSTSSKVGNYYRVMVPNFSDQNADIEKQNPACLYIDLEDSSMLNAFNMNVHVTVPVSLGGAERVYDVDIQAARTIVYNLPTNMPYNLQIRENVDGNNVLKQPLTGSTGGAWGGTGKPSLNEPGCTIQVIKLSDLVDQAGAYQRFLERRGFGTLAQAQNYYAEIDPGEERETLGEFWDKNGFEPDGSSADDKRTYFINFNDLGFGRDMHCREESGDVACYVTNYGGADQAPGNFDLAKAANKPDALATVAMEYSAGPGGGRIVKFYAYGGGESDSERIFSADLDGAGQKFVPNLCLNCHGGVYNPENPNSPTAAEVNMGSSFREFDIYSFRDGTVANVNGPALAIGNHEIVDMADGQQPNFLEQNKIVRNSGPEAAISEIIDLWYNGTDSLPFNEDAVPSGWVTDDNIDNTEDLYLKVVAKSCRTCHIAQDSGSSSALAWATYDQFKNARNSGQIPFAVCYGEANDADKKRARFMPHANITFQNFWLDPTAYSTLGNFTGPGWSSTINSQTDFACLP